MGTWLKTLINVAHLVGKEIWWYDKRIIKELGKLWTLQSYKIPNASDNKNPIRELAPINEKIMRWPNIYMEKTQST